MTPKTTTQNLAYWAGALVVSVLLAFLSGIATHWPESGVIDWRGVWLDVIQAVLSSAPFVVAGLGLPRLGREGISSLVSEVGKSQAQAALEVEAARQIAAAPVADLDDILDPSETDKLLTLIHNVGPARAIRALNDEQYREPSREDAP